MVYRLRICSGGVTAVSESIVEGGRAFKLNALFCFRLQEIGMADNCHA